MNCYYFRVLSFFDILHYFRLHPMLLLQLSSLRLSSDQRRLRLRHIIIIIIIILSATAAEPEAFSDLPTFRSLCNNKKYSVTNDVFRVVVLGTFIAANSFARRYFRLPFLVLPGYYTIILRFGFIFSGIARKLITVLR